MYVIQLRKGEHIFRFGKHTGESETCDKLSKIVDRCVEKAKNMYKTDVYAVVSDNASNMRKMGRNVSLWNSTCNSHTGHLLLKNLVDECKEIKKDVVKIL